MQMRNPSHLGIVIIGGGNRYCRLRKTEPPSTRRNVAAVMALAAKASLQ